MSKEIEKMTAIYEKHKNTMYAVALKNIKKSAGRRGRST